MFIKEILKEGLIVRDYTDVLIDDCIDLYQNSFENNYIVLSVPPRVVQFLAKNWKCPRNELNRQVLSADLWEKERAALLAYGNDLNITQKAELCGTYYNFECPSYLIWLEFTGSDGVTHKLDAYINETSRKGDIYATKVIDGVPCEEVYSSIINTGHINPKVAKRLNSIGSVKCVGSAEEKVQYKLNSWKQQTVFETAADDCSFVTLKQLDKFDNYLYKGDPGRLADYDLTIKCSDGTQITARVDLKLLLNKLTLSDQVAHDAELLLASTLFTDEVFGERRVNSSSNPKIEETAEFKEFMLRFKARLSEAKPCFIKINKIDTATGKVDYEFYT
jgi:hypothetical protein